MPEAVFGLLGVLLGAAISGFSTHLTQTRQWRREQILELHRDISHLHNAAFPDMPWKEARWIVVNVQARLGLLGIDESVGGDIERLLRECRQKASQVAGSEIGEDVEYVWTVDTDSINRLDEYARALSAALPPRKVLPTKKVTVPGDQD